eukprot:2006501-Rhodomonas_salina.1
MNSSDAWGSRDVGVPGVGVLGGGEVRVDFARPILVEERDPAGQHAEEHDPAGQTSTPGQRSKVITVKSALRWSNVIAGSKANRIKSHHHHRVKAINHQVKGENSKRQLEVESQHTSESRSSKKVNTTRVRSKQQRNFQNDKFSQVKTGPLARVNRSTSPVQLERGAGPAAAGPASHPENDRVLGRVTLVT